MRRHHIYLLPSAFAVVTVLLSLYLTHRLVETYKRTLVVNFQWVARIRQTETLAQEASALTASGSDVLHSRDVETGSFKMQAALARFDETLGNLRDDIKKNVPPRDAPGLLTDCATLEKKIGNLLLQTDSLLSSVREGNVADAASEVAQRAASTIACCAPRYISRGFAGPSQCVFGCRNSPRLMNWPGSNGCWAGWCF